jgi:hypothetical protein
VGHWDSSMRVENVAAWIWKQEAEEPGPLSANMNCSGWNRLGPRTETWCSRTMLWKWSTTKIKLPRFSFKFLMKSLLLTWWENRFES